MNEHQWSSSPHLGPMLKFSADKAHQSWLFLFNAACCQRVRHLFSDERLAGAADILRRFALGDGSERELASLRSRARAALAEAKSAWREADRRWAAAIAARNFAAARDSARDLAKVAEQAARAVYQATGPGKNLWFACWDMAEGCCDAVAHAVSAKEDPIFGASDSAAAGASSAARRRERETQIDLLRDLFGPAELAPHFGISLFHKLEFDPAWRDWNGGLVGRLARAISEEGSFDEMTILADALEEAGCTSREILDHCRNGKEHAPDGCWVLRLLRKNEAET